MTKFKRTSSEPYTIITPLSPLSELEDFLKTNIFALGERTAGAATRSFVCGRSSCSNPLHFSLVTDHNRKFVLGLATAHDLENFVTRRGL